jgi:hypothetical protein
MRSKSIQITDNVTVDPVDIELYTIWTSVSPQFKILSAVDYTSPAYCTIITSIVGQARVVSVKMQEGGIVCAGAHTVDQVAYC